MRPLESRTMRQRPAEINIERMTWPEVEAALAAGACTAVVVAAATEQHGPHLPEATDSLLGEELACRLARALGDALVAPVIRVGCSEHHMGFPGTVTIDGELLMRLLDAYVASLRAHGFRRLVVFSSHGGNVPTLAEWKRHQAQEVVVVDDLAGYEAAMLRAVRAFGRNDAGGPHADLTETSAMLATHAHLVQSEHAVPGRQEPVALWEVFEGNLRSLAPNGVLGDPRGATAEMGEAVLRAITEFLVSCVRAEVARQHHGR